MSRDDRDKRGGHRSERYYCWCPRCRPQDFEKPRTTKKREALKEQIRLEEGSQ